MSTPEHDGDVLSRVLGDELRLARRRCGLTREQLKTRMDSDVSVQTLATYELGTRKCSVKRLHQLCVAMTVFPHDLLARVHARIADHDQSDSLVIDLHQAALDRQPELAPLHRWARERLDHSTTSEPATTHLDTNALHQLAELCGLTTPDLVGRLRRIPGPKSRQS